MTESEYTNEQLIDFMYDVMDWRDAEDLPMIYAVIEALKEREAYEAIGTVKVFETVIKSQMDYFYRLREYEKIGTVSEFRESKNFLEFLYNHIQPNEMEQYLAMYHASEEKGEYLHE